MCIETARGHKRVYRILDSSHGGFDVTDDKAGPFTALCACNPTEASHVPLDSMNGSAGFVMQAHATHTWCIHCVFKVMVGHHMQVSGVKHVQQWFQSYLLPQGYPESVAPEYSHYMAWRGCQCESCTCQCLPDTLWLSEAANTNLHMCMFQASSLHLLPSTLPCELRVSPVSDLL